MNDTSPAMAQLWQDLTETSGPKAQQVLSDIILREQVTLAEVFSVA